MTLSLKQLIRSGFTTRQAKVLQGLGGGSWRTYSWSANMTSMGSQSEYLTGWTAYNGSPLVTPTQAQIDDDGSYTSPLPLPKVTAGIWYVHLRCNGGSANGSGGPLSPDETEVMGLGAYTWPYGDIDSVETNAFTTGEDRVTKVQGTIDVPEDGFMYVYGQYKDAASVHCTNRSSTISLRMMQLVAGAPS